MARVLVVDDDDLVRATLRQMLENAGHQVLEATNGREALARFDDRVVDMVITDIIMPVKEGIETIRDLRKLAPDLKILAISGGSRGASADFLRMASKFGANTVLAKPFRREQVLKAVDEALV